MISRAPLPTTDGSARIEADGGQRRKRVSAETNRSIRAFAHPTG